MGVVALPRDHVDADVVAVLEAEFVVDEAGDDLFPEEFARKLVAEVLVGPGLVVFVDVVGAFQQIGDPADAPLGECVFEVLVLIVKYSPEFNAV